ncbi:hypothetical protein [Palleronia sp. LCG004]|uniref:hypothetical protein n=1 Tax=Palleronia sp. LCG004 TaxID=3079304 RepID=UPI00294364F1|nr:hypothetical protein [Palleronia sp. LCG004]WOI54908.1 hypothetical protein RVY76_07470 [Palleronia sp. LCG004]
MTGRPKVRGLNGWALLSLGAVIVTAAVMGFVVGLRAITLDESEVLMSYAERYAEETGGSIGDCVGLPGDGDVWMRVACLGDPPRVYGISRFGFEVDPGVDPTL